MNRGQFTRERSIGNQYSKKHGMSYTKIYSIWHRIRSRCNKNSSHKKYYYDRGIAVCKEWDSFENFLEWVLSSDYEVGLTIDRIDVNKGYSPENCRWATCKQQSNNRRVTVKLTYNGQTLSLSEWSDITGLPYHVVFKRYKKNWTPKKIIETPLIKNKSHQKGQPQGNMG